MTKFRIYARAAFEIGAILLGSMAAGWAFISIIALFLALEPGR